MHPSSVPESDPAAADPDPRPPPTGTAADRRPFAGGSPLIAAVGEALDAWSREATTQALTSLVAGVDRGLEAGWAALCTWPPTDVPAVIAPGAPAEFVREFDGTDGRWPAVAVEDVVASPGDGPAGSSALGRLTVHGTPGSPPAGALALASVVAGHVLSRRAAPGRHDVDPLTGLAGRAAFRLALERAVEEADRSNVRIALAVIDLDDFKLVNDGRGHAVGDKVLIELAGRLEARRRPGMVIGRIGDDEFGVLFAGEAAAAPSDWVAGARGLIRSPVTVDGRPHEMTASVGLAFTEGEDAEGLLEAAEGALGQAKADGGDRMVAADPVMRARAHRRVELEQDLRRALRTDELTVHYQPQVSVESGLLSGVEALVRWEHPEHGLVHPGAFLEVAEGSGLIVDIGRLVLEQACREGAELVERAGERPFTVSVNVSAIQLADPGLPEEVARALRSSALAPHRLCLEVTESSIVGRSVRVRTGFDRLRSLGVRLSIDDFGTGYSSLEYLRELPVDELKIDRAFVIGLAEDAGERMVQAICSIAEALELEVVAEGVDDKAQVGILKRAGVDVLQGFLFSKAKPFTEVAKDVRSDRPRRLR